MPDQVFGTGKIMPEQGEAIGVDSKGNPIDIYGNPVSPGTGGTSLNGSPEQIAGLLAEIRSSMKALVRRLCPSFLMIPIRLSNVAAGVVNTYTVGVDFNAILCSLTSGVVNVYFGGSQSGIPDLQFTAYGNPVYIPVPVRNDGQITVVVDALSPTPANGVIYVVAV